MPHLSPAQVDLHLFVPRAAARKDSLTYTGTVLGEGVSR